MNITLAVDEEIVKKAREYAKKHGTTLNALIREHLQLISDNERRIAEAKAGLREMRKNSRISFEPGTKIKKLARDED